MSQENVEMVRGLLAEWERGNFDPTSAFHPEVRVRWLDTPEGRTETVGLEEAAGALREWLGSFQDGSLRPEQIIDSRDKVVVIAVWHARGKASGALTEWRHGQVWNIRDGKVVSIISYTKPSEALEAAGLSE
jgi:ketosteroid isomerase-like protein